MGIHEGYALQLATCERCEFRTTPRNKIHRHNFYEACLVVAGSGTFQHGDKTYALKRGDLFIADDGVYHEILSLETRDLELVFLSFGIQHVAGHHVDTAASPTIERFLSSHALQMHGQLHLSLEFDLLFDLQRRNSSTAVDYRREHMRLLVLRLMDALTVTANRQRNAVKPSDWLQRVIEAVDRSLHESLRVADLARQSAMSERTFRRMIRKEARQTITALIQARRLRRATHLLLLPEFSAAEIGYQLGIADPAQFSRWFKEMTGMTPRRFRLTTRPADPKLDGVSMATEFMRQ